MPPISLAPVAAAVVVVALAACGDEAPASPGSTSAGSDTSGGGSASAGRDRFPVTITRTGGVAGFRDSVAVEVDGTVLATTGRGEVRCTLDATALDTLRRAASRIDSSDVAAPAPSGTADQMEVVVRAGTGSTGIDDPRIAPAVPVVDRLLADVTGPAASRSVCR